MKSLLCLLVITFFTLAACNNGDTGNASAPNNRNLLDLPPYGGLTDSIEADKKNASLYYLRAERLIQAGKYELADEDLLKAWELQPSELLAEARVNTLFLQGKNREALVLLKDFAAKYPENMNLKRRLAEALVQNGQFDQAIRSYEKIIAEDSFNFEAWYEKALLYLEKKDTAAAIRDLESSYRMQPLQITALTLANLYAEKKDPRSILLADQVIERDSAKELLDPLFIKGIYYANTKQFAKALEQFNRCIQMDWKFHEAYIEKGIIYYDQHNLDEALQQFKLAATVTNTYPDAYYWQGRCYEALGMKDDALNNYARAYTLDRNFKEAVEAAARVRKNLN